MVKSKTLLKLFAFLIFASIAVLLYEQATAPIQASEDEVGDRHNRKYRFVKANQHSYISQDTIEKITEVGNHPPISTERKAIQFDDPNLIGLIREIWLDPPSSVIGHGVSWTSTVEQNTLLDNLSNQQKNGFFIEVRTGNDIVSPTTFLEVKRNWTGLIMEPGTVTFSSLNAIKRKVFPTEECPDNKKKFHVTFVEDEERVINDHPGSIHCFSISFILLAIKQTTVDYVSLDLNGAAPLFLKTIPLRKLDVKVLGVKCEQDEEKNTSAALLSTGYAMMKRSGPWVFYAKKDWRYAPGATYGKDRPPLGNYNEKDKVYAVGHNDDRIPPEIEQMDQDDPKLVKLIQDVWLDKPSTDPTTFNHPEVLSNAMWQQDRFVDKLLKQKTGGFFIEAGAVDGEAASNSYFFEVQRNWTGLLVEPDPIAYNLLKTKHRKAYSVNSCLDSSVKKAEFDVEWRHGHIEMIHNETIGKPVLHDHPRYLTTVYCLPIFSILQAIGQTTIDFFSLDVEGAEPNVLRSIPFDKLDIKILCIEMEHCGEKVIDDILVPAGYEFVRRIEIDLIYVKKSWKYGGG